MFFKKHFSKNPISVLSGPNFAKEIAFGKPTASLIASKSISDSKKISKPRIKLHLKTLINNTYILRLGSETGGPSAAKSIFEKNQNFAEINALVDPTTPI